MKQPDIKFVKASLMKWYFEFSGNCFLCKETKYSRLHYCDPTKKFNSEVYCPKCYHTYRDYKSKRYKASKRIVNILNMRPEVIHKIDDKLVILGILRIKSISDDIRKSLEARLFIL